MTFKPEHEIYNRRFSRNLGVGLVLAAFVTLTFFLTLEKVTHGNTLDAVQGKPYADRTQAVTPQVQP